MSTEFEHNRSLQAANASQRSPRKRRVRFRSLVTKLILIGIIGAAGWYLYTKSSEAASEPGTAPTIDGQTFKADSVKVSPDDGSDRFLIITPSPTNPPLGR